MTPDVVKRVESMQELRAAFFPRMTQEDRLKSATPAQIGTDIAKATVRAMSHRAS